MCVPASSNRHSIASLTPLLIGIQQQLDQPIQLDVLASRYGYSPFHFHRLFTETIGETPKRYLERLRLEKAALKLQISDDQVLDVALAVGFGSHETFTRAFKRHFGQSPRDFRKLGRQLQLDRLSKKRSYVGEECTVSATRFERLRSMHLICLRNVGDYYAIPRAFCPEDRLWNRLIGWARAGGVPYRPVPLGFYYDDPTVTPLNAQRCDACIAVETPTTGERSIRTLEFEGGLYGVVEHVGPSSTLDRAFYALADDIRASGKYTFRDAPALEIEREVTISGEASIPATDVYLPVMKR